LGQQPTRLTIIGLHMPASVFGSGWSKLLDLQLFETGWHSVLHLDALTALTSLSLGV
jgi:hypothetical protein